MQILNKIECWVLTQPRFHGIICPSSCDTLLGKKDGEQCEEYSQVCKIIRLVW